MVSDVGSDRKHSIDWCWKGPGQEKNFGLSPTSFGKSQPQATAGNSLKNSRLLRMDQIEGNYSC